MTLAILALTSQSVSGGSGALDVGPLKAAINKVA